MSEIHLYMKPSERIGVYLENHIAKDIFIDRQTETVQIDQIYIGKVRNVDQSIQAAFIDIGDNQPGFLPLKEYPFAEQDPLSDGKTMIVQVVKAPYQQKGAKLTANITISSSGLVYMPYGHYVAFSHKIAESDKERLQVFIKNQLQKQEGVILRTNSVTLSEDELQAQLQTARERMNAIIQLAKEHKPPFCLEKTSIVPNQLVNRYISYPIQRVVVDHPLAMKRLKQEQPSLANCIETAYPMPLIEGKTIDQLLDKLMQPVIHTHSGITVTIQATEALTVIDIDSHRFKGKTNKQETIKQINREAVEVCINEIRRRNIAGMIVIDFLKMKRKADQELLLQQLRQFSKQDPVRTEVYGMTKLGLVEMTRKREGPSVTELLTDTGVVPSQNRSLQSMSFQLERELIALHHTNAEAVLIKVHPTIKYIFQREVVPNMTTTFTLHVYMIEDQQETSYQMVRTGSMELIDEYRPVDPKASIDKVI